MSQVLYPRVVIFQGQELRVLDLATGIEFIAEDIFQIVSPYFRLGITEITKYNFIEIVPVKWRRKRSIVIFDETHEFDTLCWLALTHIFKIFDYKDARDFIKWLRCEVATFSATF